MKRAHALIIVPIAAVTLAGCGSDSDGPKTEHSMGQSAAPAAGAQTPAGQHNDQDVMFAQMMIPHHQQALEMAKLAKTRASMSEVKKLAAAIEAAQDPEIQRMTGWLRNWGATVPAGDAAMGGHSMGHSTEGMMSEAEMKKLDKLKGMAFDTAFLQMMIKHHEGAITMAKAQQSGGSFTEAKTMAGSIVTSQSAEITKMKGLLKAM